MPLLISFIEKMGIEEDLEDIFDHEGYVYSTTDLLLSAITGITAGVDRLYHLNALRNDAALTKALGLDRLPEETNLRRQLTKSSTKEVERTRQVLSKNLAGANQTDKIVQRGLDIDSTVATVYGKQEGAEVGYNPTKKGRPLEPSFRVEYSFYVTNISDKELDTLSCYRFYKNRATVENRIKEQKLGFNLDKLPVHNKQGNEVYILLAALTYNILNWFKRFLFPKEFRSKCIKWIRMYLLKLPAIIKRKKKQYFIKILQVSSLQGACKLYL